MTDAELIEVCSEFRDGILDGRSSAMMCAAVSWPLCTYLDVFHGVKGETIETDLGEMNHVWILLEDGRALDPTADQFNRLFPEMKLPPVYLGPLLRIHVEPAAQTLSSGRKPPAPFPSRSGLGPVAVKQWRAG